MKNGDAAHIEHTEMRGSGARIIAENVGFLCTGGFFIQNKRVSLRCSVFYFVRRCNRSANFCTHSHQANISFIERPFFHSFSKTFLVAHFFCSFTQICFTFPVLLASFYLCHLCFLSLFDCALLRFLPVFKYFIFQATCQICHSLQCLGFYTVPKYRVLA